MKKLTVTVALVFPLLGIATGCGHNAPFVWIDQYQPGDSLQNSWMLVQELKNHTAAH